MSLVHTSDVVPERTVYGNFRVLAVRAGSTATPQQVTDVMKPEPPYEAVEPFLDVGAVSEVTWSARVDGGVGSLRFVEISEILAMWAPQSGTTVALVGKHDDHGFVCLIFEDLRIDPITRGEGKRSLDLYFGYRDAYWLIPPKEADA